MARGRQSELALDKAGYEAQVLELRTAHDVELFRARARVHKRILANIDWWMDQAEKVAEHGSACDGDQVKVSMIKCILDKVCPDLKEMSRGAATVGNTKVNINNVSRAGAPAAQTTRVVSTAEGVAVQTENGAEPAVSE